MKEAGSQSKLVVGSAEAVSVTAEHDGGNASFRIQSAQKHVLASGSAFSFDGRELTFLIGDSEGEMRLVFEFTDTDSGKFEIKSHADGLEMRVVFENCQDIMTTNTPIALGRCQGHRLYLHNQIHSAKRADNGLRARLVHYTFFLGEAIDDAI